jgi:hypothetical protein
MDFADVKACLEKDGWPIEVVSDTTIRSRFRGGEGVLPLFVHREAEYMTFAVIPFFKLPKDEEAALPVVERLLRWNRDMNMAKFSIDEDSDVVLSVEYRLEDLDPSEVRDAVDVLSFYAEKYRADLLALTSAS